MSPSGGILLILGSGPNVISATQWLRRPFDTVVAINNAWQVRDDWDYLVFPEDFPHSRRPRTLAPGHTLIQAPDYIPAQNRYGGILYVGATMALNTGYWALHALRPRVMAFLGCDMVYPPGGNTHFYGTGAADPLRGDVTLRDLRAKSARLFLLAARQGCACVNLSHLPSRLMFPRVLRAELCQTRALGVAEAIVQTPLAAEHHLGYHAPSGRYDPADFDTTAIDRVDRLWRHAHTQATRDIMCGAGHPAPVPPQQLNAKRTAQTHAPRSDPDPRRAAL